MLCFKEASISPEIPVTEVRKSWFAQPETSPNFPYCESHTTGTENGYATTIFQTSVTGIFGEIDTSLFQTVKFDQKSPFQSSSTQAYMSFKKK